MSQIYEKQKVTNVVTFAEELKNITHKPHNNSNQVLSVRVQVQIPLSALSRLSLFLVFFNPNLPLKFQRPKENNIFPPGVRSENH